LEIWPQLARTTGVEFPGGLTITGHVIRAVGGSPAAPTIIEVSADSPMTGKVRPNGSDLLDRMRSANADDKGTFASF
jgi:hypothetical protein